MRAPAIALLLLASASPAPARDWDFNSLADEMEMRLNARRVHIPMMWLVRFAANVARPVGVKDFQLAIWQRVDLARFEQTGLDRLHAGWRPVVRVRSRRENTVIYARDEGSWTRMLVMAVNGREATMVHFQFRPTRLLTFVAERARHSSGSTGSDFDSLGDSPSDAEAQ